jgi:NAD(P)-dependent dehydrogenase (short-subunit alcohol dehydrogenase family)
MRILATLLAFLFIATPTASAQVLNDPNPRQLAILITGASSGIGLRTTELLASKGFFVYAGARKEKDLKMLNAMENVQSVKLDVTVQSEIDAAVQLVKDGGRGLYGLINNAGVAVVAPLLEVSEDDLNFQWDVNVFGPYRVTKAFAPMIIESKGRISITGSIAGTLTWSLGGPYSMSKHAIEAYTETLAAEMGPLGVKVSVVEPGNYKSKITSNMQQRMKDHGHSTEGSRYKGQLDRLMGSPQDRAQYKEPDEVAEAFLHFFTSEQPKLRYMVVPNRIEATLTVSAAMKKVVQLNQDQEHAFTREELIKLLDFALAQ